MESMTAPLTIRALDEQTQAQLEGRAAQHGRTMEEEAAEILRSVLSPSRGDRYRSRGNLAEAIRKQFAPLGGVELILPPRR